MDAILIKILATALVLSQLFTRPEEVKTEFDPARDRGEVVQLLRDGCTHMRRAFDIEDINIDDLIETAMSDPEAVTGQFKAFRGIKFSDLHTLYRQFCGAEEPDKASGTLESAIEYYNKAVADLPDHTKMKGLALPGTSLILDQKSKRFAEVYEPDHRRIWVPLSDIPQSVQQAFVAAEDKRFLEHRGIDERAVIRAFVGSLGGKQQGGSTITQQLVKNLLVGDDVTYDRKMREMIVATRVERVLTKAEILEFYLNSIYLGRGSWGIEMAAQSYFGKSVAKLTLTESAYLAGLPKGPNYYAPDKHPERARQRLAYVLSRMQEDGAVTADQMAQALAEAPGFVALAMPRNDAGLHFIDHLAREAKARAGIERLTAASYTVRSTIQLNLQRATEEALQEGLARYELSTGRMRFQGAEANLTDAVGRIEARQDPNQLQPAWRQALADVRLPLYDVHWTPAVVVEKLEGKSGPARLRVGLRDGRILPLKVSRAEFRRNLRLFDVLNVRVAEGKGKAGATAELRVRPTVQGAALVLENETGRILAMSGGFSYPLSQLNRVTQSQRQPGSAFKPLSYLAALNSGLQPNTLVWDTPVTLPPIRDKAHPRAGDYWTPKNYDSGSSGPITLRRALENSKNLVTANLLNGITAEPEESLTRICGLALEAQLYKECVRHYPFVLGAQPVRLLDLAAFYAAVANEGALPAPYAIESIEQAGREIYRRPAETLTWIGSADRVAFYQLKTMLQGVLQRGTARSIRHLAPYVAGKTGTTDNENDAWFIGFTNHVTVAVWVGYDNADGKRHTLGSGQTGARVAVPIFQPIMEAAWAHHSPKAVMNPASPEAARNLIARSTDLRTGDQVAGTGGQSIIEHFRTDPSGRLNDTQYRFVRREAAYAFQRPDPWPDGETRRPWNGHGASGSPFGQSPWWRPAPQETPPGSWPRASARPYWWDYEERRRQERRVDPDYFWGFR